MYLYIYIHIYIYICDFYGNTLLRMNWVQDTNLDMADFKLRTLVQSEALVGNCVQLVNMTPNFTLVYGTYAGSFHGVYELSFKFLYLGGPTL